MTPLPELNSLPREMPPPPELEDPGGRRAARTRRS